MIRFRALFLGESRKIWKRVNTLVLAVLIPLITFGAIAFIYGLDVKDSVKELSGSISNITGQLDEGSYQGDWKTELQNSINLRKNQVEIQKKEDLNMSYIFIGGLEHSIARDEFRLNNNIPKDNLGNFSFMAYSQALFNFLASLVLVFVLVAGASSVASEYTDGTIKFLLPRPFKRWKILLAKYLAVLSYLTVFIIYSVLLSVLSGVIIYGTENVGDSVVAAIGSYAFEISRIGYYGILVLFIFLGTLFSTTIGFFISTLCRNRGLAIGLTLLIYFVGAGIFQVLSMLLSPLAFLPFTNIDLSYFMMTGAIYKGLTFPISLTLYIAYLALMIFFSFFSFVKRDTN